MRSPSCSSGTKPRGLTFAKSGGLFSSTSTSTNGILFYKLSKANETIIKLALLQIKIFLPKKPINNGKRTEWIPTWSVGVINKIGRPCNRSLIC